MKRNTTVRESFCESEEGVRLPTETADLRGSPGNLQGSPGNFRGSLGNFRGTSGLLFSSTVKELPGKSTKTSGEIRGTSGEVRGRGSLTSSQRLAKFVSKFWEILESGEFADSRDSRGNRWESSTFSRDSRDSRDFFQRKPPFVMIPFSSPDFPFYFQKPKKNLENIEDPVTRQICVQNRRHFKKGAPEPSQQTPPLVLSGPSNRDLRQYTLKTLSALIKEIHAFLLN